jgi:hypothetical protein
VLHFRFEVAKRYFCFCLMNRWCERGGGARAKPAVDILSGAQDARGGQHGELRFEGAESQFEHSSSNGS